MTNDDRAALLLAAQLLDRINRRGLAGRLRGIAHSPQEQARHAREAARRYVKASQPDRPHAKAGQPGRLRSDIQAVAMVVRQANDLDVYSLFMEAQRVRPSELTAHVWRRAEELRRVQQPYTPRG